MRFLNSVVIQFVGIGITLFLIDVLAFPAPKPTLGPPNQQRVAQQAQALEQLQQIPLSENQRLSIKKRELRDELLFIEALERGIIDQDLIVQRRLIRNMRFMNPDREEVDADLLAEAWELRLHLSDEVIRRRTVQVMETLIVALGGASATDVDTLKAAYDARLADFAEPERFSFTHVFMREEAPASRVDALEALVQKDTKPDEARRASDVFLAGYQFSNLSLVEIARQFGEEFALTFASQSLDVGQWSEPVPSVFGRHWVWLEDKTASRIKRFDEVEAELRRDARRYADELAIQSWVDERMKGYEVTF